MQQAVGCAEAPGAAGLDSATGSRHPSSALRPWSYYGANVLLHRDRLDARLELIDVIRVAKEHRDPDHPTSGFGRLDAFDGTRNFLFTRLRKADAGATFEVNSANLVKLDAAVKFPPLWSRKAMPPEPVEAYRDQPGRFPSVWGFKDYDWIEWTIDTNTVMERNITETLGAGATVVLDPQRTVAVRQLHPGHEHARARMAGLLSSTRRAGRRRRSARSSPTLPRLERRSSADAAPGAMSTAMISARRPG